MPVIPALRRLRQENLEFEVSMKYMVRPCLKKKNVKDPAQSNTVNHLK
jgi:hypothetical protein